MKHLSVLSRCVLALTLCLVSWMVSAQLAPMPQRALSWLASQVQDAVLQDESRSAATGPQARSEAVSTLQALSTLPQRMADSVFGLAADDTEYLARRVIAGQAVGRELGVLMAALVARQSADGSVAAAPGGRGSALDTAWAVRAWAAGARAADPAAVKARAYLSSLVQATGEPALVGVMSMGASGQKLHTAALLSLALQTGTDAASLQAVRRLSSYLVAQQAADGAWLDDPLITAQVLEAVVGAGSDASVRARAAQYLESRQAGDGSWGQDAYITSVALRALTMAAPPVGAGVTEQPLPQVNSAPPSTRSSVTAVVIDATSGQPLSGVSASLKAASAATLVSALTDAQGRFTFKDIDPGAYALQLQRSGYDTRSSDVQVGVGQTISFGQIDLHANATTGVIRGVVIRQANSAALPGASITLSSAAGTRTALSDAQGRFEFNGVAPGQVGLRAALAGYQEALGSAVLAAGQTLEFSPALAVIGAPGGAGGVFSAVVVDAASGQPLSGVAVTLVNTTASSTQRGSTGVQGAVTLSGLLPGEYQLSYALAGYREITRRFVLPAGTNVDGGTVQLSVQSSTVEVSGTVKAPDGRALSGAAIQVFGADGSTLNAVAAADGQYRLTGLAAGTLRLRASAAGHEAREAVLTSSGGAVRLDIVLPLVAPVSPGLALSAAASNATVPAAGQATVNALLHNQGDTHRVVALQLHVHDAQGQYVGAGTAMGSNGIPQSQFDLAAGAHLDVPLLWSVGAMPAGRYTTWVRAYESGSGALLAQASVSIEVLPGARTPDLTIRRVERGTATSDAQTFAVSGRLRVDLLNQGNAQVPKDFAVLAFSDLDLNGRFDAGVDTPLGYMRVAQGLDAGASQILEMPVQGTLPFRDAPIHVMADADEVVVEANELNNVASSANAAEVQPAIGAFKPKLKWHWTGSTVHPDFNQVMMAPVVGRVVDTNGDGRVTAEDVPVVVFTSFNRAGSTWTTEGVIRVVHGGTGQELLSIRDSSAPISAVGSLALADLDHDGAPEIIAMTQNYGVAVYRNNGTKWWSTGRLENGASSAPWGGAAIADIDGDGQPEVVVGRNVYSASGQLLWRAGGTFFGGASGSPQFSLPVLADLFGTGQQNLILGASVYSPAGQLLWADRDGFVAVADFDRDGVPEIACVSAGTVALYRRDGQRLWSVSLPGGGGGPPTIADVDGDGVPEIGVAGSSAYTVFRANGTVLWSRQAQDFSSQMTGSTVFDFDGDGAAEVLYADEIKIRVYAGATGASIWEIPNSSGTTHEYPLVVDVDADGHADMVTIANDYSRPSNATELFHGVRVFQDESNAWVNVRPVWNQHAYSITHINDDLTVPARPVPSWQAHNTFRLNTTTGRSPTAVADGTLGQLRVEAAAAAGQSVVHARIGNAGSLPLPAQVKAALYAEQAGGSRVLLGTVDVGLALSAGQYADIAWPASLLQGAAKLVAVLDDDGAGRSLVSDYDRSNNRADLDLVNYPLALELGMGIDKPAYGVAQPVLLTGRVLNLAAVPASAARVRLSVQAPDGQIVSVLGTFDTLAIAAGDVQAVSAIWNTGTWLAGAGYLGKAELLDGLGRVVKSRSQAFAIVGAAQGAGLGTKILSDKVSYGSNETVTLTDRLVNEVSNTVLEDLVARTSVRGPGGALVWETTQPLAQLVGGSVKELGYRVALGNAAAGRYNATLTVLDAGGQVLSSAATGFDVTSTAASGAGLGGTLSVVGSPVSAGDAAAIQWSVLNKGNSGFDALPVMIRIIDPAGERELAKLTVGPLALPGGQTIARAQSWTTDATLVDKTLVAVLTAQVGTASIDLAQASFVVTKPPVKLDVAQDIKAGTGGTAKVLVLYDCEPDLGWDLLGWLRLSYSHICYKERAQYLSSYLNSLNVAHYITYDRNAFRRELRSGAYTSIWMLGALPDCGPHLLNEVREAVNRGATLLVDGGTTAYENHALYRLAGARYGGHIWLSNKAMDVSGASFTSTRLSTVGQPLRLSLTGGTVLASYPRQYCYRVDYDGDDNTPHPSGSSYPAVVGNAYGRGKALAFGFDLISALRNGGSDTAAWKRFVTETAGYLKPLDEQRALVAGEMAVFGTKLSNQGSPVGIEARMSLPAAAQVVGTTPQAVLEPGNKVLWKFDLGAGQSVPLQLTLRAPLSTGSYTVGSEMAVVRNGQKQPYASYSQSFNVMDSLAPAKAAYQKLLSLTGVPFLETLTWLSAKVNLDYGIKLYQQGRYHEAVEELGEAANNIRQLSAPLSAERLAVDRLMQEAQYRWYLAQPK